MHAIEKIKARTSRAMKWRQGLLWHLILIAALGLAAYSNTFDAPFQWDEKVFMVGNPIIADLDYFVHPAKATGFRWFNYFSDRYVSYLSFALNYAVHGYDVFGYHVVNLAIHIMTAFLAYALVRMLFLTPYMLGAAFEGRAGLLGLAVGALFVAHPINTEAVTYIYQRQASLVAFFYLLSIVSYIASRLMASRWRWGFYALSIASAILAMKTKENAFTLPVAIMMVEAAFFTGPVLRRVAKLVPLGLTMLVIPLTSHLGALNNNSEAVASASLALYMKSYLMTQFRVIGTYLRIMWLPVNQNLDYDYAMSFSMREPIVVASFVMVSAHLLVAAILYAASLFGGRRELRLAAFGILFFFVSMAVESSILPIPQIIDEYRVYLPGVGFFLTGFTLVFMAIEYIGRVRPSMVRPVGAAVVAVVLLMATATYARNEVWRSELSLWSDVAAKSPGKARPHNNLGILYEAEGQFARAFIEYQRAIAADPGYSEARINLGVLYERLGKYEDAAREFTKALEIDQSLVDAHYNLGVAFAAMGNYREAEEQLKTFLRFVPYDFEAHYTLGLAYSREEKHEDALKEFKVALGIKPDYVPAHNALGDIYLDIGEHERAIKEFEYSLRLSPGDNAARSALARLRRAQHSGG